MMIVFFFSDEKSMGTGGIYPAVDGCFSVFFLPECGVERGFKLPH